MDVTCEALYALYGECFPCYPLSREWFFSLLALEQGEIFTRWEGGALAGAAVLHGDSLPLLCVGKSFRGRGLGSQLLAQAEERAKSQGHSQVVLGQGPHYLFQGVPEENPGAVEFFQKRGYQAAWSSVNMRLDLAGYEPGQVDIPPVPEGIAFRLLETGEEPALLAAVEDAQPTWLEFYQGCPSPILVAAEQGQLVGFAMVPPEGGRFFGGRGEARLFGVRGRGEKPPQPGHRHGHGAGGHPLAEGAGLRQHRAAVCGLGGLVSQGGLLHLSADVDGGKKPVSNKGRPGAALASHRRSISS